MNHPGMYRNKEVVVLGLARSGIAAAQLFHAHGAKVIVNDRKQRHLCPEAESLEALGISVICGEHPERLIHPGVALLVKNPGIPYTIPPIAVAEELGIEIVTEVEVAYHMCNLPMIGITGSNGKTTTTTWISEMLTSAGKQHLVAGNIGTPLCEAVQHAESDQMLLVELSSFQLKGTAAFRPRIACMLNVYESHLDYHQTMDDYMNSKFKIFVNQTKEDIAVLNWDDPHCRRFMSEIKAEIIPFSAKEQLHAGVFLEPANHDRMIVFRDMHGARQTILPVSRLGIPGAHNVENALGATAVALALGVKAEIIAKVLEQFRGVEHRLEFVREKDGIRFYNNSKATNAMATIKALESFDRPIVLIAGGQDRGVDFMELLPYFRDKVKAVVTMGEAGGKLFRIAELAGLSKIHSVNNEGDTAHTLISAVRAAHGFAEAGDIVLLSPACASWDMFSSFEERGHIFKQAAHNL